MPNLLVNRIIPVFLFVMAVAVALNLILTPVYHDGSADYVVWKIMNWPMAVGVAIALIAGYIRYRAAKREGPDSMKSLRATLVFYGAIVLAIIFYWNWMMDPEPGQRDRLSRDQPHDLLPAGGRPLYSNWPLHGQVSLARHGIIAADNSAFCSWQRRPI